MPRMNGRKQNLFSTDKHTMMNHEGHTVHRLDALETLFSKVMGSFFGERNFYVDRDAYSAFDEVRNLLCDVPDNEKEYVLKLAMLGRQLGMIQYPLALLTACFNDDRFKGDKFLAANGRNAMYQYADQIVLRGKDIVDVMTFQMKGIGCEPTDKGRNIPLPMQLRKCMKHKLECMPDYTLAKGLSVGNEVSLADCIKMLRPNPRVHEDNGGRYHFYSDVLNNNVSFADGVATVQTELVKFGQGKKADPVEFAKVIGNTPVLAVLKNLVAIHRVFGFDHEPILMALRKKFSPTSVEKSKVLPFRFYSTYKEVFSLTHTRGTSEVLDMLEDAMDNSVSNLTEIEGYNAILIDRSGSMKQKISSRSIVTADEMACLLGAIVLKRTKGDVYVFGSTAKQVVHMNSRNTILSLMNNIRTTNVGGSTYIDTALELIGRSGVKYDNLIILTDGDVYTVDRDAFYFSRRSYSSISCDDMVNDQMKRGIYKRVFINDLTGNNFSAVNVSDYRKNLVCGFTEKFVEMINLYSKMQRTGNICKLIDGMLMELHNK